ncbi:glutathione S-transferase [Shewanella sp.]|uniref:glutathione S-transferase n=1 Tax=Shewanella sp. TaxID=50422 RepID=UPI004053AD9D
MNKSFLPLDNHFQPILYSFRRCPYAMRARMALQLSSIQVETREIELKNKPPAMVALSPKATVPVLQLGENSVLDESLDIMLLALSHPIEPLLSSGCEAASASSEIIGPLDYQHLIARVQNLAQRNEDLALIAQNDNQFKPWLDKYKYAERFPEQTEAFYRQQGEIFIAELETRLTQHALLSGSQLSLNDIAIFPFIRQFAHVNKAWFEQSPYPKVNAWLTALIDSPLFTSIMVKRPVWQWA